MEIIGVHHEGKHVLDAVTTYVDAYYPNLKSIMLELPPGYEQMRKLGFSPFFSELAEHFSSRGVRVISGDKKRWALVGLSLDEALNMMQENPDKYERLERISALKGFFNGKLIHDRNCGLNETLEEERPEVSVVGALHGVYLKKHNADTYFSYFTTKSVMEKLFGGFLISRTADKTYLLTPEYNYGEKIEYAKSFRTCLAASALMLAGGTELFKPHIPVIDTVFCVFGTVSLLGNFKQGMYYIKTLVNKNNLTGDN